MSSRAVQLRRNPIPFAQRYADSISSCAFHTSISPGPLRELLNTGVVDSVLVGGRRKILVHSLLQYLERGKNVRRGEPAWLTAPKTVSKGAVSGYTKRV